MGEGKEEARQMAGTMKKSTGHGGKKED